MSAQPQFYVLATLFRDIAHHAGEPPEQLFDWHHAHFHHRTLKIIQHPGLERHGIRETAARRILGMVPGEFIQRPLQHGFADDQLAHQIQQVVDAFGVHSQDVFRVRRNRFADILIVMGGDARGSPPLIAVSVPDAGRTSAGRRGGAGCPAAPVWWREVRWRRPGPGKRWWGFGILRTESGPACRSPAATASAWQLRWMRHPAAIPALLPLQPSALSTSCRAAMGMAHAGSICTRTW